VKKLNLWLSLCLGAAIAPGVQAQSQSSVPAYQTPPTASAGSMGNQGIAELYFMIEQLRNEVRQLRGVVEEQRYEMNQLQQRARDRYQDLDQRILELGKGPQGAAPAPAASSQAVASEAKEPVEYRQPSAEEQAKYDRIIALIRDDRDYDKAIDQLYDFIGQYPQGDLTVNAYYWLGEVYLAKPQLEQAKQAFTIVATRYSDHRKAPDSLYKLALAEDRMGNQAEARKRLKSLLDRYPDTSAANLARPYLGKLGG